MQIPRPQSFCIWHSEWERQNSVLSNLPSDSKAWETWRSTAQEESLLILSHCTAKHSLTGSTLGQILGPVWGVVKGRRELSQQVCRPTMVHASSLQKKVEQMGYARSPTCLPQLSTVIATKVAQAACPLRKYLGPEVFGNSDDFVTFMDR
jgi:hypothetical protein